ncbi:uncharacterized protein LOC144631155 [Oculina patagonica]
MPDQGRYKSLLIVNESSDAQVTLYLYRRWDFLCWISLESKIIKPHEKYLHRSDKRFKYEVVARFEDSRSKRTLLGPKEWVEDKLLKITESLDVIEGKLEDFPKEKTGCLLKLQRDKSELKSTNGTRNLYAILGLDMDQVRKMPKEEQIKAIKKGFRREIQRWHPDKNFGDDENAKEIIMAQEILLDGEKRACYHNRADYDKGWLSLKRWKAIFKPECFSEGQKRDYRIRMSMLALSTGMTLVGIAACVLSGGIYTPIAIAYGAVIGAGVGSVLRQLGTAHAESWISVSGEGKNVRLKQILGPAEFGAAAVAAGVGEAEAVSANLERSVREQVTGARRLDNTPASRNIPRALTESGTEAVMGTIAQFAEERLDPDSVENRNSGEHLANGVKNEDVNVPEECNVAVVSHIWNEISVPRKVKAKIKNRKQKSSSSEDKTKVGIHKKRQTSGKDSVNEHLNNWQQNKCSVQTHDIEAPLTDECWTLSTIYESIGHSFNENAKRSIKILVEKYFRPTN